MDTYKKTGSGIECALIGSDGKELGGGFGQSNESALYCACIDAVYRGNYDAGCGFSRLLKKASEEAAIRKIAKKTQAERAVLIHATLNDILETCSATGPDFRLSVVAHISGIPVPAVKFAMEALGYWADERRNSNARKVGT